MGKKFKKETIASKAGIGTDIQHGAIVPPLYLGTNFEYEEIGKEPPYEYSRQGNPTRDHLIQALSDLEEGLGGEILSSGMAAISLVANILELKSIVERAYILADGMIVERAHLSESVNYEEEVIQEEVEQEHYKFIEMQLDELERFHICQMLDHLGGNKTKTAKKLGITVKTLYNKLHTYGMIGNRDTE